MCGICGVYQERPGDPEFLGKATVRMQRVYDFSHLGAGNPIEPPNVLISIISAPARR